MRLIFLKQLFETINERFIIGFFQGYFSVKVSAVSFLQIYL